MIARTLSTRRHRAAARGAGASCARESAPREPGGHAPRRARAARGGRCRERRGGLRRRRASARRRSPTTRSELRIEALVAAGAPDAALAAAAGLRRALPGSVAPLARRGARGARARRARRRARGARGLRAGAGRALRRRCRAPAAASPRSRESHERSGETRRGGRALARRSTRATRRAPRRRAPRRALARLAVRRIPRSSTARPRRCASAARGSRARSATRRRSASCDAALAAAPGDRSLLRERAELLLPRRAATPRRRGVRGARRRATLNARFWRARSLARSGRIEESLADLRARSARAATRSSRRARASWPARSRGHRSRRPRRPAIARSAEQRAARRAALGGALAARLAGVAAGRRSRPRAAALERFVADEPDPAERAARALLARARARAGSAGREGREARLAALAREEPLTLLRLARCEPARGGRAGGAATWPRRRRPGARWLCRLCRRRCSAASRSCSRRVSTSAPRARSGRSPAGREPATRGSRSRSCCSRPGSFHRAQRLVAGRATPTSSRACRRPAARRSGGSPGPRRTTQAVERAAARARRRARARLRDHARGERLPAGRAVGGGRARAHADHARHGTRLASRPRRREPSTRPSCSCPTRNLELGAFYLSQLARALRRARCRRRSRATTPGPRRWRAGSRRETRAEDDEWVEAIPYDQTRSYVKRVLRSLHVYRTLYGS